MTVSKERKAELTAQFGNSPVDTGNPKVQGRGSKTSADASVESHLIALAAEESRLQNGTAIHMKEWRTTV